MSDATVQSSPAARSLVEDIARESGRLYVLLDDSGCCGPGNVFLQSERPRPSYHPFGHVGLVPVYADPGFVRDARPSDLRLEVRPAPRDDSLSMETRRGVRLVVRFARAGDAPAAPDPA